MKSKRLLLNLLIVCTTLGLKGQNFQLKSFKIISVGFGITSPMSVSCSEFENSFSSKYYVTKMFTDSAQVSELERALKKTKYRKNYSDSIDVRVKIYFNYGASQPEKTLCINKFYDMELDGKSLKGNTTLRNILKQMLKTFE